jgi:hypothetical protein
MLKNKFMAVQKFTFGLLVYCFDYFSALKIDAICSTKRRWTSIGLHGVKSQMIEVFRIHTDIR